MNRFRLKALFIQTKNGATVEDAIQVAKKEACKIGMTRNLLRAVHAEYLSNLNGWVVVLSDGCSNPMVVEEGRRKCTV